MEDDRILIAEAAKILGVCVMTLRHWHKKGKLVPEVQPISKYRLYSKAAIEKFLEEYKDTKED